MVDLGQSAIAGQRVIQVAKLSAQRDTCLEQFDRLQQWRSNREGMQARSRAGAAGPIL